MNYAVKNFSIKVNTSGILRIKKIVGLNSVFLLAACFMLYGQNSYLDLALLTLIFGVFATNLKKDIFFLYYFAIMFFEPVLNLPFELGSVFRIYQLLFLTKILLDAKKGVTFAVPQLHKILLSIMLITWSVVTNQGTSNILSMIINLVILLYIFSRISSSEQNDKNYSQMLFTMFLFSFLSGFYGLYGGSQMIIGGVSRYSGTIGDPNYTALFYLLGIFSLLGTNVIYSSRVKAVLFSIMFIFILLTVSLTGIAGLAVLLIIYYLFKDKKVALVAIIVIIFSVLCAAHFPIESGAFHGLKTRVTFSIDSIRNGDYALLTSNRSNLSSDYLSYFFTQSQKTILFGGQNIIAGNYRKSMLNMFAVVSHNSYIDMLYAMGILGTLFILACFIYDIIRSLLRYKTTKKEYYLTFAFLKLTILWFSLGISIFPYRYFLVYMFL